MATKTTKKPVQPPQPQPEPPFDAADEVATLFKWVDRAIAVWQLELDAFKAKLEKDALGALEWSCGAMQAAAYIHLYRRLDPLRTASNLTPEEVLGRLSSHLDRELNDILMSFGRHYNNSTNGICQQLEDEAKARIHRDLREILSDIRRRQCASITEAFGEATGVFPR